MWLVTEPRNRHLQTPHRAVVWLPQTLPAPSMSALGCGAGAHVFVTVAHSFDKAVDTFDPHLQPLPERCSTTTRTVCGSSAASSQLRRASRKSAPASRKPSRSRRLRTSIRSRDRHAVRRGRGESGVAAVGHADGGVRQHLAMRGIGQEDRVRRADDLTDIRAAVRDEDAVAGQAGLVRQALERGADAAALIHQNDASTQADEGDGGERHEHQQAMLGVVHQGQRPRQRLLSMGRLAVL